MKIKFPLVITLMTLTGSFAFGQSNSNSTTDVPVSTIDHNARLLEAIAIINDAITAPTKYNEYVTPFMDKKSFPKDSENFDSDLKQWFLTNPEILEELFIERKKAHTKLYGPRPY